MNDFCSLLIDFVKWTIIGRLREGLSSRLETRGANRGNKTKRECNGLIQYNIPARFPFARFSARCEITNRGAATQHFEANCKAPAHGSRCKGILSHYPNPGSSGSKVSGGRTDLQTAIAAPTMNPLGNRPDKSYPCHHPLSVYPGLGPI